jgi:NAD(P)-dependent dehydrogenase (short-subunit alcohol dehydrogenase family)
MSRQRIVITGGGSGLGRALALVYAADGWRVALLDRDEQRARDVAAEVDAAGGKGLAVGCNVSDPDSVRAAAGIVRRAWKGLDVLVNNAGIAGSGTVVETPLRDWRRILDVNLLGVVVVCQAFLPSMMRAGAGHVVNIASAAGLVSPPGVAAYNASKAAVISLSESLRAELAESGIGVSVVCPSFFRTNLLDDFHGSEASRQVALRLMDKSPLSAKDVARQIHRAVRRKEFMVVPHAETRRILMLKRVSPELFYAAVRKRAILFLKAQSGKAERR